MGKYAESYKLAKKANGMFLQIKEEQLSQMGSNPDEEAAMPKEMEMSIKVNFVISYYNMAIAAECTGNKKIALEHASQGYHFSLVDLGPEHPLCGSLQEYLDKLATEVAQGIMSKIPGKPKREDPSARQHDTSYFSGKQSETGVNELTGVSTGKKSFAKGVKDRSVYNNGGTFLLR